MDLWTSPSDRHAPYGSWGPTVDNADGLLTACPHSRASRPRIPQDLQPFDHEEKETRDRTVLRAPDTRENL